MLSNGQFEEKHNGSSLFVIISLASGLGAFSTGFTLMLLNGLSYIDATALGGMAMIPGLLAGLIGRSVFYLFKRNMKSAITLGYAAGMAVYTSLLSITAEPVKGFLPFLAMPENPALAALIGCIGGIAGGCTVAFISPFNKNKIG